MPAETTSQLTKQIALAVGNNVVVAQPCRFCSILVSVATTGIITVYDNATTNSGTVVGYLPTSQAAGVFQAYDLACANGITINLSAGVGTVTIGYGVG